MIIIRIFTFLSTISNLVYGKSHRYIEAETDVMKIEREAQLNRKHAEQGRRKLYSNTQVLDENIFSIVPRYHEYERRGEVNRYLKAL